MCKLKSAIILKDSVFIPDYDSHSKMLEELQIEDTKNNAERLFVRAELYPENGDVFSPIDQWKFNVDQDIVPDWYVAGYDEERMRNAVKEWAKNRIHIGENNIRIDCGENHYIKDCQNVVIYDSASISKVCGSASIGEVYDSASIGEVYGSASIGYVCGSASISYVYGSASIGEVYDSASIGEVYDSASISKVCGSAIISSPSFGWKNKEKVVISENATFKDNQTKTIWQSGDWKIEILNKENKE